MNDTDKAALQLAAAWAENLRKRLTKPDATPGAVRDIVHGIQLTILGVIDGGETDWLPESDPFALRAGFVPLPEPEPDDGTDADD
jgi:hypothetical protein